MCHLIRLVLVLVLTNQEVIAQKSISVLEDLQQMVIEVEKELKCPREFNINTGFEL